MQRSGIHADATQKAKKQPPQSPPPGTESPLGGGNDGDAFEVGGRQFRVSMSWLNPVGCREDRGWGKRSPLWFIPADVVVKWL